MAARILTGDCRQVLATLTECSVDAIVTDPPYHLVANKNESPTKASPDAAQRARANAGFMGMKWDGGDVAFQPETWRAALRVAKPGAYLLAFGGPRTYHRLACAIEDGGWEIRDQLMWIFGSGFPKSKNVGDGRGTALKPAHEPIVLARKPFTGTVTANVALHGTGALNIDACRIDLAGESIEFSGKGGIPCRHTPEEPRRGAPLRMRSAEVGRWPANVMHDGSDEVVALFPDEASAAAPVTRRNAAKFDKVYGAFNGCVDEAGSTFQGDTGSAARFFYCPKVDRAERDDGMHGFEKRPLNWSSGDQSPGTFQAPGTDRAARNYHPTVKPTELMRWLVRLVTPPGGAVLDCFMGSGSTGRACELEGLDFIGIDDNPAYVQIAAARIRAIAPLLAQVDVA